MLAQQMKYEGEILYASIASDAAPGYTNKEWSTLLTAGQEKVVKDIVDKGWDKEEKYRKAIAALLSPTTVLLAAMPADPNIDNARVVSIAANVLRTTMERCSTSTKSIITVKPITYDYYLANIKNPHKKPDINYVFWRLQGFDTDKKHIVITDGSTLVDYKYVSVTKPEPIIIEDSTYVAGDGSIDGIAFSAHTASSLECTLGTFIHRWIVQEAVNIAFASDKDTVGYQISNAENIENIKNN
jgi:hypothetical protein